MWPYVGIFWHKNGHNRAKIVAMPKGIMGGFFGIIRSSLDKSIFIACGLIIADPQLNVIGSGLWQCRAEPRRVVELAAGTSRTTPLTIPQRIVKVYCCE